MTAGVLARVPRVAAIVVGLGLASATLTLAADSTQPDTAPLAAAAPAAPAELVVPDVRRQAYVFAKGTLEQSGFAWRVEGSVQGYAANVVVSQEPAAGSRVVANGAPTVVLRLTRNTAYPQEGLPESKAPYPGTPAKLVGAKAEPKPKSRPARAVAETKPTKPAATKPAATKPAKPAAARPPAFEVRGAPAEPLDEITLPERAKRLAAWVEAHPDVTPQAVNHWLYQHSWIVTGARFGWSGGAEALRTLVAVDARVQELWTVGGRSRQLAREALADVEARSR
jgi:hypothetical protein